MRLRNVRECNQNEPSLQRCAECWEVGAAPVRLGERRGGTPAGHCGRGPSFGCSECGVCGQIPRQSPRLPTSVICAGAGLGARGGQSSGTIAERSRVRHPPRSHDQSLDLSLSGRVTGQEARSKGRETRSERRVQRRQRPWAQGVETPPG